MLSVQSSLGFGGASLTSMPNYTAVKRLLNHAYALGIRHFDTAALYGKGYSELIYGHFLKDKRKDITLTTKFGLGDFKTNKIPVELLLPLNYHLKRIKNTLKRTPLPNSLSDNAPHTSLAYRQINKSDIERQFQTSLSRLQTDYIDYYLLHEGLPAFLTDDALAFLFDLKKQGRIRFIGLGTHILDIKTLTNNDLQNWDVLQYGGGHEAAALEIREKFPNKIHFHHSCIQQKDPLSINSKNSSIGQTLAQCARNNPEGKIIFSTRNQDRLSANIYEFLKTINNNALH